MEEVSYTCKRTVVSTTPIRPGKTHSLSSLERLMEPNSHLMIVLYYRTSRTLSPGELTKQLRESLAETLSCFPAVTGRLVKDQSGEDGTNKWMVTCNDAGVRMVEARAKGSVEEWLESVDSEKEKRFLIHWEEMFHKPYFWATFYIQLTEFDEGGLAIGLSCTHLLADLVSATNFIKAWADITLRGKMMHPPIFHRFLTRRSGDQEPNRKSGLINHYRALMGATHTNSALTNIKYTTISLVFSDQMVRSCISTARAQDGNGPGPSPFEALAGLIWASVSRVKGLKQGLVGLSMGLDMRKLLGLDEGYFGNCMVYANVQATNEETNLKAAAKAIREEKAKIDREGIIDLMEWKEENEEIEPKNIGLQDFCNLVCLNLEHVDLYSIVFDEDFEGPIQVGYYIDSVCEKGSFLILPSQRGDGQFSRVVVATLPEDEVLNLCKDELILSFNPTIRTSPNKH